MGSLTSMIVCDGWVGSVRPKPGEKIIMLFH